MTGETRVATDTLLQSKNVDWLPEGEPPLTAEQFASKIRLGSIEVDEDGSSTRYHNDGGLFREHSILVRVSPEGECYSASIAG